MGIDLHLYHITYQHCLRTLDMNLGICSVKQLTGDVHLRPLMLCKFGDKLYNYRNCKLYIP